MGVRIDEFPVLIIFQTIGLNVLLVKPWSPESVLPGGVEVGLDGGVKVLFPFVCPEDFPGEDGAEDGARVVVAVIDPFVGICPPEQTVCRTIGVASRTILELLERIVGKTFRNGFIFLVIKKFPGYCEGHGALSLDVVPDPVAVGLAAVFVDRRAMSLEDSE